MAEVADNEVERTTERTLSGGRFDSDNIELDLSRILFSASSELVTYVFGNEVVSARQQSARHRNCAGM
jgi:hypothetical protein